MIRVFFFLLGFGLMVIGCSFIILYLNLTTIGYNFLEYVNFIIRRIECLYSVIGIVIIIACSYIKKIPIFGSACFAIEVISLAAFFSIDLIFVACIDMPFCSWISISSSNEIIIFIRWKCPVVIVPTEKKVVIGGGKVGRCVTFYVIFCNSFFR